MITQKNIAISQYTYDLPAELIAYHPTSARGSSKQLIYKKNKITDDVFENIADHLPKNALLIFNNTRVINARLHFATETGALIEVFVLEPLAGHFIEQSLSAKKNIELKCLVGNIKRWKKEYLTLSTRNFTLKVKIKERKEDEVIIHFEWDADLSFYEILEQCGKIPLPPYIKREATETDKTQYQTVLANHKGSVAAPTAALHFTSEKINELRSKGFDCETLTLHVGAGTFKQVKSETMQGHQMHSEEISVTIDTLEKLESHNGPIVAIGTTSARTLESLYWLACKYKDATEIAPLTLEQWEAYELAPPESYNFRNAIQDLIALLRKKNLNNLIARTALIIAPGYQFRAVKGLVTNFHQPQSTLLLLVAALIGDDWKKVYLHAIEKKYRFFSYGDSSYLEP